jgi:UDP-N-acetylmuramoyl-tripeptide--D-alanyl-D-alanine ligase
MKLTIDEIIKATNGEIIFNKCNYGKIGISTDTRTIKEDEIYLPLKGENYDGHDFINEALKLGCIGYFIDKEHHKNIGNYYNPTKLVILVDDTLEAYLKLSNYIKKK